MLEQKSAVIVHVTSMLSNSHCFTPACRMRRLRPLCPFTAAGFKALSPKGIRVVRVAPGWVETEAAEALVKRIAEAKGTDEDKVRQLIMDSRGGVPL